MQAIVDRLEPLIQRHPEQWYMFRPMWPGDSGAGGGGGASAAAE
jgi:lauroyl/myristoyl acyltransferase